MLFRTVLLRVISISEIVADSMFLGNIPVTSVTLSVLVSLEMTITFLEHWNLTFTGI